MRFTSAVKLPGLFLLLAALQGYGQDVRETRIDELLSAYAKTYKLNGTVLVAKGGKIIFSKGYGFRNVKDSTHNDVNTIYQLGSVTKQFTAAVILKLAEQKKLSLNDRITKYFPAYPNGDSITIRHLLTHSSGIYNYTEDQQFMKNEAVKPSTQEKMIALFRDRPANFPPGQKYAYSNSGYLLLGYIIEKVARKPYEQVVREMILSPLKMTHSGFNFTNLVSLNKATGYVMFSEYAKIPGDIVDSSVSFSAGALYSTVEDLNLWHNALQQNKVISKASTNEAYTPYKSKYGFGWSIDTLYGKRIVEHGGAIFGFNSFISRVPAEDVVVIILNNINVSGHEKIAHSLLAIMFDKPYDLPKPKVEVAVDEKILQDYVGDYELIPGFIMKVTLHNSKLKVQPTGQPPYDLFAESDTEFFMKIVEAKATFVRGADGRVEKMLWDQNGRVQSGKKIK